MLQNFDLCKINRNHNAFSRMKAAKFCFGCFVDDAVILNRRFPTHTTKQANCFHIYSLQIKGCIHQVEERFKKFFRSQQERTKLNIWKNVPAQKNPFRATTPIQISFYKFWLY